jgi:membrane protein
MVWVNLNVILLLLGNELNIAIRKLRIEKILADEMKHEIEEYQQSIPEIPENSAKNTIVLDSNHNS